MKRFALIAQLLALLCLLVACYASDITPTPFTSPVIPTPGVNTSPISPVVEPVAEDEVKPLAPNFRLDPLTVDSTEATGQGPIGFTLVIVDATAGAKILGTGQADAEGDFRIPLNSAPRGGHLMGLTVDLTPEQLASEELMLRFFDIRGPGFRLVPQIVTVYDAVEVPER